MFGRAPRDSRLLSKYVQFAQSLGCTLYDPQERIVITEETIDQVLGGMEKFG